MPIKIFFRGVGVYVKHELTVVEALFPNAEELTPPNGETGDDGLPRHADNTRATHHFAGVLIRRPGGDEYRKLLGRLVEFQAGPPTEIDAAFPESFPPLHAMTDGDRFGLTLLPEADRQKPNGRVAMRIKLFGGRLTPSTPSTMPFNIDGHHSNTGAIKNQPYSTGAELTLDSAGTLELKVSKFSSSGPIREQSIMLNPGDSAFFYNFDNALPTPEELSNEETKVKCKGRLSDHDFKWIYQLMDFDSSSFDSWQAWLEGEEFPTPWTPCSRLQRMVPTGTEGCFETRLLPISTCFETVVEE